MEEEFRSSVVVKPFERLDAEQVERLHRASLDILAEPGLWCYNRRAAELYGQHGAAVREAKVNQGTCWRVSLPAGLVEEALAQAPSKVVLGAREPANRLVLEAGVPRVYFGSGSEANIWLETEMAEFSGPEGEKRLLPRYQKLRGSTELLGRAAHLCEHLEHLDFFIRPLNIQDQGIDADNHDVNKFFASLNNITKHVQAGLTSLERLPDVLRLAELVAGGPGALAENPLISFITCLFKSPLQLVNDTCDKLYAMVEAGVPVVMSSSPQGGSSAPVQEAGMVAQINAEIIAGVALTQLIKPGAPVLYGSVPVRARMDDLHDLYGCPEFNHYNIDCVQLARRYRIPCYSSAGVGDAKAPGMQAVFEKMLTQLYMCMSGAQYIHYAFGLLDRTNTFCPVQAVLDNEQIGKVKRCFMDPQVDQEEVDQALKVVGKVMGSASRLFARHARRAIHGGYVSEPYRFEGKGMEDVVVQRALERMEEIMGRPRAHLAPELVEKIYAEVPGLLPGLRQAA